MFIEAYKRLCHPSPGDVTQVNECALRANICGNGRCIDTPDGYQCDCYPGYQKGESEVCEGQSSFHIVFVLLENVILFTLLHRYRLIKNSYNLFLIHGLFAKK